MKFVSNRLRKMARAGIALGIALPAYANAYANNSNNFQQYPSYKNSPALQLASRNEKLAKYESATSESDISTPAYDPKPEPREMPGHYFDGFVGFFNPETGGIGIIPRELTPAYAREHIEMHEGDHWRLHRMRADHDEAWINRMVANRMANKTGRDTFPFESYFHYGMF